ncbi:uncharacterized protein [Lolium perenne]|uniref:uncharacterized protein isoform X3 n=1 Tax=Lolium perenne TaxID=4522 RepID=UPI003A9950AF
MVALQTVCMFNSLLHYYYQVQYTGAYQLLKFMLQPRIYQHQKYISQFLYGRDRWFWRSSREEGAREAVQRQSWRIREGLCWPGSVPHEDEHISLLTPSELSFFQLMAGLGGLTGARFSHHMLGSDISSSLGSVYPMGLYYSVYLATGSYCCRSKRRVFPELKPPATAPACCCCREKSQASSVKQELMQKL